MVSGPVQTFSIAMEDGKFSLGSFGMKSVERLAAANGFDSWIMFNVYPQRATDPNDMGACTD